jgi:hypothetical protein
MKVIVAAVSLSIAVAIPQKASAWGDAATKPLR